MDPEQHRLIEQHADLARQVAASIWRQAPSSMELSELVSLANLGLVMAAERWPSYCAKNGYDPARTEYFTTFAQRRMQGAIRDSLRRDDHATRSQRTKAKRLQSEGHDAGASESELSERTGMTAAEIRSTLAAVAKKPVSFDAQEIDDPTAHENVESSSMETHLLDSLREAVLSLPPPQQCVLALHYFAEYELQQVAQLMGITESRASHLHTDAVLAVKEALVRAAEDLPGLASEAS